VSQHSISDANLCIFFSLLEFTEEEDCHIFQVGDAKNWVSTLW